MKIRMRLPIVALLIALPLMCGSIIKLPELHDINGHWAEEYIVESAERGIISGYSNGLFMPEQPVTRAEFIKMAITAFPVTERIGENALQTASFGDISGHWAQSYIEAAYRADLIMGADDTHFLPDAPLVRQDAVLILSRIESFLGTAIAEVQPDADFLDKEYIRADCADAVRHLSRAGVIAGKTGNLFDPIGNLTRAEAVKCIIFTIRGMETPSISAKQ